MNNYIITNKSNSRIKEKLLSLYNEYTPKINEIVTYIYTIKDSSEDFRDILNKIYVNITNIKWRDDDESNSSDNSNDSN